MSEKEKYLVKIIDYITNVLKRKKTITHEDKLKLLLKLSHLVHHYYIVACTIPLYKQIFLCNSLSLKQLSIINKFL